MWGGANRPNLGGFSRLTIIHPVRVTFVVGMTCDENYWKWSVASLILLDNGKRRRQGNINYLL